MMKLSGPLRILAIASLLAMPALANANPISLGFEGDYAPLNWSLSRGGIPAAGGGYPDIIDAPDSITLVGGDEGCGFGPCFMDLTIASPVIGLVEFAWDYLTFDDSPEFDTFGFLLNGAYTQLTDDLGDFNQFGVESFLVGIGDVFGFRLDCQDCQFGSADAIIYDFSVTDVPEPGALALLAAGLLGGAFVRRRRR